MSKQSAIKTSLFAAEEREQKLDRKGDLLSTLEKHVSFAALAVVPAFLWAAAFQQHPGCQHHVGFP